MREADTKGHTVWFHSQEVLEEPDLERQEVDGGARGSGGGSVTGDSFPLGK